MNTQNVVAALIHDNLGQMLTGVFSGGVGPDLLDLQVNEGDTLLGQLTGPGDGPPRISIVFGLDLFGSSIETVVDDLPAPPGGPFALLKGKDRADLVNDVRKALRGRLRVLEGQHDAIAGLIAAQNPADLRAAAERLFAGVRDAFGGIGGSAVESVTRLRQLLGSDVGIALPFATILRALQRAGGNVASIPESVERGLLDYFFTEKGFKTVDGEEVVAAVHVSDVKHALVEAAEQRDLSGRQLRGLFPKTTAERYLRDIIRVIVECAYDAGRDLRGPSARFADVVSGLRARASQVKPADAIEAQFVTWFRGFAAMAESTAMRAVEVGTQGVSEFQTNPLIAAAAGSFSGTVARKLAQDAFLAVLQTELAHTPAAPPGSP